MAGFIFAFAILSFEDEIDFFEAYGFCLNHHISANHARVLGLTYLFVLSVDGFFYLNAYLVGRNIQFTHFCLQNFPLLM